MREKAPPKKTEQGFKPFLRASLEKSLNFLRRLKSLNALNLQMQVR